MTPDGDASPPLAIDVDPNKVAGFADTLKVNVQGTIAPTAPGLTNTLSTGVTFGHDSPSIALQAMLDTYANCLITMTEQLKNVGTCVDILVNVANQISANYSSSDQLVEASIGDINSVVLGAVATVVAKQIPPTPTGGGRNEPRYA
ncbi:MAG TPA: hypothetical protein VKB59_11270 [Micromonosporaceae bacterium]|nr:hypothetical protein [Micromonosporaceae bacterium]